MQDTRYLVLRGGNTWLVTKPVPRHLRSLLGKSHLRESTKTTDPVIARGRRHAVLARFQTIIDEAQRQHSAGEVMGAAAQWREHLAKLRRGDLTHVWDSRYPEGGEPLRRAALYHAAEFIEEDAAEVAAKYGPAIAEAYRGVATGTATPLLHHVDDWLREGGHRGPLNLRTQNQYRSIITAFAQWCERSHVPPTIEAITTRMVGDYITEAVAKGMNNITHNSHISAASSYWKWLRKRVGVATNPWAGQSRSKVSARNGDRAKRPFTDDELRTLLQGGADQELHDAMCTGALSGMRLEEIYSLTVHDCRDGVFNIRAAKTPAGVRPVPQHSALADIVARRTTGKKATEYLFDEAGPARPGRERSMAISKRFGRYRLALNVEDREEGRRHSRIDFHSLRRWFITRARNAGIDQAVVAAIVGHRAGNLADDCYSGGPEMAQRRRCVAAVRLPG